MGTNVPPMLTKPMLKYDGILGDKTWRTLLFPDDGSGVEPIWQTAEITKTTVNGVYEPEPPKPQEPFICPCCGGNSYSVINGNIRCDYCNTKFGDKIW